MSALTFPHAESPETIEAVENRTAMAEGTIYLGENAFNKVKNKEIAKGDVLSYAEVTAILASKQTSTLLPYSRPNSINDIVVNCHLNSEEPSITVKAFAKTRGMIGVQMESLMAVSMACLSIYEMCKSESSDMRIDNIHIVSKTGGISGDYRRN